MKKIIISLVSAVLLSGAFCQAMAQQYYHFPSAKEAQKIFTQGYELLTNMQEGKFSPAAIPDKINPKNVPIPYMQDFPFRSQEKYGHTFYNPYQDIQAALLKEYYKEEIKYYQDFYNQIVWKKDGFPDLTKPDTMKAYLAFYNLILNKGNPIKPEIGYVDENLPLLGVHSEAFAKLQERFGNNDAYLSFTLSISMVRGVTAMIPKKDTNQAEEIAKDILYNDLQKYGMTVGQIDEWLEVTTTDEIGKTLLDDIAANGVLAQVSLDPKWYNLLFLRPKDELLVMDDFEYVPFGLIALHEFEHAKDLFPGRERDVEDSLSELPTYVMEIVMLDNIYRQIHNIPDTQLISYKHGDESINLGEIADLFRKLSKKYHTNNWPELLLTPEATRYINNVYKKQTEIAGRLVIQRQYGVNADLVSKDKIQEVGRQVIREMYLEEMFRDTNRTGKVIPK